MVTPQEQNMAYDSLLGFDSRSGKYLVSLRGKDVGGLVKPMEVLSISSQPQLPFRCRHFTVWAPCASNFLLHDIRLGTASQMASAVAPVHLSAFATQLDMLSVLSTNLEKDGVVKLEIEKQALEVLPKLVLPTVGPGMNIVLTVENIGSLSQRFLAMMIG